VVVVQLRELVQNISNLESRISGRETKNDCKKRLSYEIEI